MPLRAKAPSKIEKRLKALFYGGAGSGKTTACIQFPKSYLIDTERGAENDQYVKLLEDKGGVIYQSSDFDDIYQEVKTLLTEQHDFKTLIIDPITTVYSNLLAQVEKTTGSDFGRHYGEAAKRMKSLMDLLARLDMNVIVTAHSKNEYGEDFKVIRQTFDGYKKLDYFFDLVLEIQKRGKERFALVRKSRIGTLEEAEGFAFSYDTLADKYGRGAIEKPATAESLATPEQINEINQLLTLLKEPEETTDKWLRKAKASSLDEMSQDNIQKCIDLLRKKLEIKT